jgi:hypothetical protein
MLATTSLPAAAMVGVGDGVNPLTQQVEQVLPLGEVPPAAGAEDRVAPHWRFKLQLVAASGDTAPARQVLPGWCLGIESGTGSWRDLQATLQAAAQAEQIERRSCRSQQRFVLVPQLSSDPGARSVTALLQGELKPDELFVFAPLTQWQREGMARWPRERVLRHLSAGSTQEAILLTRRLADPAGHAFFGRGLVGGWAKRQLDQLLVFVHDDQGRLRAVFRDLPAAQEQTQGQAAAPRQRLALRIEAGPLGVEAISALGVTPLGDGVATAGAPAPVAPRWLFPRDRAGGFQGIRGGGEGTDRLLTPQRADDGFMQLRSAEGRVWLYQADEQGRLTEFVDGKQRHSYFHHPTQPRLAAVLAPDGCATVFERVDATATLQFSMFSEACGTQQRFEQNAMRWDADGRYTARQLGRQGKKIDADADFGSFDD